jgi:glycosidase
MDNNGLVGAAGHNVTAEIGKANSLLEFYRALYRVRLTYPVLATGSLRVLSRPGDPLLIFSRSSPDDTVYVAIEAKTPAVFVLARPAG